jgi:mRNA-degrading endonuclease YafQ of YafQ-DinJ toxin-antitoxin module
VYELHWTDFFSRRAKKFLEKHPELVDEFKKVILLLESDPRHPYLKFHALSGELAGKAAVSLSFKYRVVIEVIDNSKVVVLHDVGSHDEVYGR